VACGKGIAGNNGMIAALRTSGKQSSQTKFT